MFDLSFLIGRSCFSDDEPQNYLILQLISNTFTRPTSNIETIIASKSKELKTESINPSATANNNFTSKMEWFHDPKIVVEFKGAA